MEVRGFRGEWDWLSNFYPAPTPWKGQIYLCREAAFQSAKCARLEDSLAFLRLNGPQAKRKGRTVFLRSDWEAVKVLTMYKIVKNCFEHNPKLKDKLIATYPHVTAFIKENNWGDLFWGQSNGIGQNQLGKIIFRIREELR